MAAEGDSTGLLSLIGVEEEDRSGGIEGLIGSDRLIRREREREKAWLLHVWDHDVGPMARIALESRDELASWLVRKKET